MIRQQIYNFFHRFISGKFWKSGSRILVFLFFVIISTLLWFFKALEKEYTTEIRYPVTYKTPHNRVVVNDLPKELLLKIRSRGFNIMTLFYGDSIFPLTINAAELKRLVSAYDTLHFLLFDHQIQPDLQKQLPSNVELIDFSPDTIVFELTGRADKRVPVRCILRDDTKNAISCQQQFMVSGDVIIEPDTIIISGPGTIIDTIQYVTTVDTILQGIDHDVSLRLPIKGIDIVKFRQKSVKVFIPVEQFTEMQYKVAVDQLNVPPGVQLKVFPMTVSVTCMVPLSQYTQITADQFRAVVDYNKVNSESTKLKVRMQKVPRVIREMNFYPRSVEYIIEK